MGTASEGKAGLLARGLGRTLSEAGHSLSEASRTLSESSADLVRTAGRTLSGRTAELVRTISEKSKALFCRRRWADMEDTDDERSPGGRLYLTGARKASQEIGFGTEEKASPSSDESLSSLRKRGHQFEPVGHHEEQKITSRGTGRAAPWICERRSRGKQRQADDKLQCQFLIGIEENKQFQVKGRIFGRGGQNMKNIVQQAGDGTKLRLRGRGSGFLEGSKKKESSDPLMLCVSAPNEIAYQKAKILTTELLEGIYSDYRQFHGKASNELRIQINEGARAGAF
eukprot:TRINITY_DN88281_c0_g1_i1.p1 TRINITY_DN88281_c0_g1~~TRINITY_DN88281_c0_g1_i1.p1  ORF type:complete len:284 (+),score=32.49 TRINITY_DN88281_c0_g1_i1:118-969(+)